MEAHLSRGAVAAISEGGATAAGAQLVLQVFRMTRLQWPAPERYSVGLSDGAHFIIGILPKSVNHLARCGHIRSGTVVRLLDFALRAICFDRVIEVKQLEVLQTDCVMIGNPKEYQSPHLEDKPAPSYAELVNKFTELNSEAYSAAQGLKANLTRGMVAMLQQPVVQVVSVSPMTSELKKFEMYHLILSDGVHTQDATLESHLNYLVKDPHLRKGTIVRLLEFMYNTIQSPSMIIVIQLEVLQKESELIGSPKGHFTTVADYANPYSGQYSSGQGLKRPLTQGAVAAMLEGEMGVEQRPVMQVVDVSVMTHNGFSFYRLVLSDGIHKVNANLFPHLSHLVEENCLRKGTIVCLLKFMCDRVLDQNQSCMELEVLETECELIGSPTFYQLRNKKKQDSNHAACVLVNDPERSTGGSHPT
ncbi:hypothetical protein ACP70R_014932 [Stipagrostis hirtigluma subsp. patula]